MGGVPSSEKNLSRRHLPIIDFATVLPKLQTGDILLCSGMYQGSQAYKQFQQCCYSHVAMVVIHPDYPDRPCMWESTDLSFCPDVEDGLCKIGPQLVFVDERIKGYYGKIIWRPLLVERTPEMLENLKKFRDEVRGRPYELSKIEMVKASFGIKQTEKAESYFCSELIAESYQRMGLISDKLSSNNFLCYHFADTRRGRKYMKLLKGASFGSEQLFNVGPESAETEPNFLMRLAELVGINLEPDLPNQFVITLKEAENLRHLATDGDAEKKSDAYCIFLNGYFEGLEHQPHTVKVVSKNSVSTGHSVWNQVLVLPAPENPKRLRMLVADKEHLGSDHMLGSASIDVSMLVPDGPSIDKWVNLQHDQRVHIEVRLEKRPQKADLYTIPETHMLMSHNPQKRPLMLAHRGASTKHQENTMAAFRSALEMGADGVELDVMLTKDREIVITHDANLLRLTGRDVFVQDITLEEFRQLRVKKELTYGDHTMVYPQEEPMCTLREMLEEFAFKMVINIELKAKKLITEEDTELGTAVAQLVHAMNVEKSVFFTSFSVGNLHSLEKEFPNLHSGFSYDRKHHNEFLGHVVGWVDRFQELIQNDAKLLPAENDDPMLVVRWIMEADLVGKAIGSTLVSCDAFLLDTDTISQFHTKGKMIGVYTLPKLEEMDLSDPAYGGESDIRYSEVLENFKRLQEAYVDYVITDDVERLLAWREKYHYEKVLQHVQL